MDIDKTLGHTGERCEWADAMLGEDIPCTKESKCPYSRCPWDGLDIWALDLLSKTKKIRESKGLK